MAFLTLGHIPLSFLLCSIILASSSTAKEGSQESILPSLPPSTPILKSPQSLHPPREPPHAPSLGYRPPPGAIRREVKSAGLCAYDGTKWRTEARTTIASAVMFHRETGIDCEECLARCERRFQNASATAPWLCRSLTYDSDWHICDLFAVNGTDEPYHLVEHPARDYFEYLPALPPTDAQLLASFGRLPSTPTSAPKGTIRSTRAGGVVNLVDVEPIDGNVVGQEVGDGLDGREEVAAKTGEDNALPSPNIKTRRKGGLDEGEAPISVDAEAISSSSASNSSSTTKPLKKEEEKPSTPSSTTTTPSVTRPSSGGNNTTNEGQLTDSGVAFKEQVDEWIKDFDRRHKHFHHHTIMHPQRIGGSHHQPSSSAIVETSAVAAAWKGSQSSSSSSVFEYINSTRVVGQVRGWKPSLSIRPIGGSSSEGGGEINSSKQLRTRIGKKTGKAALISPRPSSNNDEEESRKTKNRREESQAFAQQSPKIPTAPPTWSPSCPTGHFPRYLHFPQYPANSPAATAKRAASSSSKPQAPSVEEGQVWKEASDAVDSTLDSCLDSCDKKPPNEASSSTTGSGGCQSVRFNRRSGKCEWSDATTNHTVASKELSKKISTNGRREQDSDTREPAIARDEDGGVSYLEKVCLPLGMKTAKSRSYLAMTGHILVGHVQEVVTVANLSQCVKACLDAWETELGFVCKSAMWYPEDVDQNCLLNAESRHSKPDMFVEEDQGAAVVYFETDVSAHESKGAAESGAMKKTKSSGSSGSSLRFKDSPIESTNGQADGERSTAAWTFWSRECNPSKMPLKDPHTKKVVMETRWLRYRYLKCTYEKDVRKCPKEMLPCRLNPRYNS